MDGAEGGVLSKALQGSRWLQLDGNTAVFVAPWVVERDAGREMAGRAGSFLTPALSPDQASPSHTVAQSLGRCWTQRPGQSRPQGLTDGLTGSELGNGVKFGTGCEFRP